MRVTVVLAALAAALPVASAQVPPAPAGPAAAPAPGASAPEVRSLPGWPVYDRFCLACHGLAGDGRGPAAPWLDPLPRDFTAGLFRWVSTGDASAPARSDLAEAIEWGVPGTAMHPFAATLTEAQIDAVIDVVRGFAGHAPDELELGARGRYAVYALTGAAKQAQVARGRELWTSLGCPACHGDGGRGDGPSAATLKDATGATYPPFDLTAHPVRRPRAGDDLLDVEAAILTSILWGVGGTAMPGFDGAAPLPDLMALSAYVASIGPEAGGGSDAARSSTPPIPGIPAAAIARDRDRRWTEAGYRPSAPGDPEGALFGATIALQGAPPAGLAPVQASLSSQQCARCHAKQVREWRGSIHAAASSPGLIAQVMRVEGAEVESCQRCHAPLAEQQPIVRPGQEGGDDRSRAYRASPFFDEALRGEGLTCAACHVRGWVRHGPPAPAPSLLALPGYPLRELAVYERADFCIGCHQLPPRLAVAGRPLLDTYREWLYGPYMRRGIQCQHCHMPDREHTWKGVHDPDTFRQGIAVTAIAGRGASGVVSVRARVTNVGAGHYLPTTPTPAAWLEVELVDGDGRVVAGASASRRIGRAIEFRNGRWHEREDTRIPPGGSIELAQGWRGGRVAAATHTRVRVRVRPDDYYEGLYKRRLTLKLAPEVRRLFEAALARAEASPYVAYEELFAIAPAAR